MHSLAIQLAPVVAAKSKAPFYVAGGALVLWALVLALVLGLRNPRFPGSERGLQAVSGITAALVAAALATAVLTSGPDKSEAAASANVSQPKIPEGAPTPGAPEAPAAASGGAAANAAAPASTTSTGAAAPAAGATGTAGTQLKLEANTSGLLSYNTKSLAAKAGTVTITMANMSPLEHNVTVELGHTVLGATPTFVGGTKSLKLTLKAGTYVFFCSVPGHRQAGMEGVLKVS
jgi:plastocyanin